MTGHTGILIALALYIHVHSTESSSTNSLSDTSTTITYVSENTTITPVPENTTITSLYETTASQLETTTTVRPTVCYDSVGCFNNLPPFDNAQEALPLSPERIGTKFLLYTSKDPDSNETFFINHVNETLLDESGYDPKLPTKFVIHGFINTIKTEWLYEMKDALLRKEDCNVIIVAWGPGAALPDYSQAVANTRVVAKQIKMVIDMMEKRGALLKQMHLIGHSLGAHTSGHVGYLLRPENRTLGRITGLDPAEPDYLHHPRPVRLDKDDADFVDVIHTNGAQLRSGGAGMWLACGHVDFYVNGGESQPDCPNQISGAISHLGELLTGNFDGFGEAVACSHSRAHAVFTESIHSLCSFTAYPCENYEKFEKGECLSCGKKGCGVLGYYADWYEARGQMYLNTRLTPPFCGSLQAFGQVDLRKQSKPLSSTTHDICSRSTLLATCPEITRLISRSDGLFKAWDLYGHHYQIQLKISQATRGTVEVQLIGTWGVSEWLHVTSNKPKNLRAGSLLSKLKVSKQEVGRITSVNIKYTKAPRDIFHWFGGEDTLHTEYVSILAGENGKRYKFCIPEPVAHRKTTTVSEAKHQCS